MDLLHYPLAFIAVLGILVTFHEFGHYLVARWSGVGILRFSVGFGRPLLSRTDKRGTQFTLAMIPLGGYVRMYDERDGLDELGEEKSGTDATARGRFVYGLASCVAHSDIPGWSHRKLYSGRRRLLGTGRCRQFQHHAGGGTC